MKKFLAPLLLVAIISCKNSENNDPDKPDPDAPKNMSVSIIKTYPHDTSSYTQGLIVYKGAMYEGTGNYGFSKLKKVDVNSGRTEREIKLAPEFFGEGVTIINDTVYQLTWKQKKVFVYTLADFKKIKEFNVDIEGWGLTNDGTNLIVSTGSSELYYYDRNNFKLLKAQTVTESGMPAGNINELEFFNGFVYANQYESPYVFKIDPATGKVVAKADVTDMWKRIKAINPAADVPNGIAYDADTKKIYITGKWWPELYEVQFSQ
jgi:glutaminyl-peptide cyclotransferase